MKKIIKSVLDRHKDDQVNLGSEVAREKLASGLNELCYLMDLIPL